jgi:hypothetical protein
MVYWYFITVVSKCEVDYLIIWKDPGIAHLLESAGIFSSLSFVVGYTVRQIQFPVIITCSLLQRRNMLQSETRYILIFASIPAITYQRRGTATADEIEQNQTQQTYNSLSTVP